jgi:hypothetical protein
MEVICMKYHFKEYDSVIATRNINERVTKGTIGCIMLVYNTENFEVEFFVNNTLGNADDVLTVSIDDIELHPNLVSTEELSGCSDY